MIWGSNQYLKGTIKLKEIFNSGPEEMEPFIYTGIGLKQTSNFVLKLIKIHTSIPFKK